MNDHEIVQALRSRTVNGLTGLYEAYAEPLYAYCWSLLGDEQTAQEALGEAFIAAEAHIDKLVDPARLQVWLYAITRNECLRHAAGPSGDRQPPAAQPTAADPETIRMPPGGAGAGGAVALDDLLSGRTPPAAPAPGTPGMPAMMVAPGVLGVPSTPPPDTASGLGAPSGAPDAGTDTAASDAESAPLAGHDDNSSASGETGTAAGRAPGVPDAEDDADIGPDDATPAAGIAAALDSVKDRDGTPVRDEEEAEPSAGQVDATGETSPDEERRLVERVVGALAPAEGELLDLAYRHGFEYADIATIVGLPAQQMQSMLAHADQQVRSGLAVERLATGGRLGSPDLATRLERGDPPAAALLLSVTPPAPPPELKPEIIGSFTAAEKVGYRMYVGRRAEPFDKNGFPVPLDRSAQQPGGQTDDEEPAARSWRWPAAGLGVAACLAAVLAAVLLWPAGGTEQTTNAAAPGDQATGLPAVPPVTLAPSATATPTSSETPSPTPTQQPTPEPETGQAPSDDGPGTDPRPGDPGDDRKTSEPPKATGSIGRPGPTSTWNPPSDPPGPTPTDPN